MKPQSTYDVEVTDTYAGQANYGWVNRYTVTLPEGATRRSLVIAAKKAAGWTGRRCNVADLGELVSIFPRGACMVAFVTYRGAA